MRVYTLETKAERTVCVDSVFRCPNPACGFTSAFRAWGRGRSAESIRSHESTVKLPGALRMSVKRAAEQQAWADAHGRAQRVTCPRCARGPNESIQFATP